MKNKKLVHLVAASWLIAPTLLAAQPAFATEEAPAQSETTASTTSSTTESSASSESTETSESSQPTPDPETKPTPMTYTAKNYSDDKGNTIEFADKNGTKFVPNAEGLIEGLKEGDELIYTVTPAENYAVSSVSIQGSTQFLPSLDQLSGTLVVGKENLSILAEFKEKPKEPEKPAPEPEKPTPEPEKPTPEPEKPEPTPEKPTPEKPTPEKPTPEPESPKPTPEKPTPSPTPEKPAPTTPENGSNGQESKPEKPSNTENQSNGKNDSGSSVSKTPAAEQPANTPAPTETGAASSSAGQLVVDGENHNDFITKTPVEAELPTNTNEMQAAIVKEAYKYLGSPYVWGAKGPNTFDCSGLAYYVYMKATGHNIGGWTGEQQFAGTQIPVSQAQPGDLLFWGPSSGVTHHVAIYIGNGQFIQAPQPGDVVRITSISDYTPDFAVRVNLSGLPQANLTDSFGSSILDGIEEGQYNFSKNQTTDQFLKKVAKYAQEIGQKDGIYASVMMAQAILESGSGNSSLASEPNYNLFGIKGSYKGQSVSFKTLEQDEGGQSYQIQAGFRKYPSYKESLEDYSKLIKNGVDGNKEFYKPTWKSETNSYKDATKYLQGRYATDKKYAQKLNAIISAYDLTKYDEAIKTNKPANTKNVSMPKVVKTDLFSKAFTSQVRSLSPTIVSDNAFVAEPAIIVHPAKRPPIIWDRWYHFSVVIDPKKEELLINPKQLPLISYLSLDKSFWLDLPII